MSDFIAQISTVVFYLFLIFLTLAWIFIKIIYSIIQCIKSSAKNNQLLGSGNGGVNQQNNENNVEVYNFRNTNMNLNMNMNANNANNANNTNARKNYNRNKLCKSIGTKSQNYWYNKYNEDIMNKKRKLEDMCLSNNNKSKSS